MSTSTANAPPFRSMQQMVKQGGRSGLVRLSFVDTPEQDALYAHEAYLMAASGVLRDLLACDEDGSASEAAGPLTKVARTSSNGDVQTAGVHAVLPLHDISVAAWEDALSLLYPSTMMTAEVSWDNAERLLILADKYDMGCITGDNHQAVDVVGKRRRQTSPHTLLLSSISSAGLASAVLLLRISCDVFLASCMVLGWQFIYQTGLSCTFWVFGQ